MNQYANKVMLATEPVFIGDNPRGYFPTGGAWPILVQDRKVGPFQRQTVKAAVRIKFSEKDTRRFDILLPNEDFSLGVEGNTLDAILKGFNNQIPVDGICLNIPFRFAENGNYLICDSAMLRANFAKFKAQPICHFDYMDGVPKLKFAGGAMVATASKSLQFVLSYKGRRQTRPTPVPKEPVFMGNEYKNHETGFYSMLTAALEGPIKDRDTTLLPQLRPYNFTAVVTALHSYWVRSAGLRAKTKFNVDFSFDGDPLDPSFHDDRLAGIRHQVQVFERKSEERSAHVERIEAAIVLAPRKAISFDL